MNGFAVEDHAGTAGATVSRRQDPSVTASVVDFAVCHLLVLLEHLAVDDRDTRLTHTLMEVNRSREQEGLNLLFALLSSHVTVGLLADMLADTSCIVSRW